MDKKDEEQHSMSKPKPLEVISDGDLTEIKKDPVWKSWLEKKRGNSNSIKLPMSDEFRKFVHHHEEERIKREKQDRKLRGSIATELRDELKAEEGVGGMNMGAQRGLGHEAGYKQDPGQSAQITEVKDEDGDDDRFNKSAYENHEQNETPETEPTKRQIPHSKPKMDTFKSLYKKALIIKYKNIYKPLNT